MSHYLEFAFKVDSNRIFGLGERMTDFVLKAGTYTLYPTITNSEVMDNGSGG